MFRPAGDSDDEDYSDFDDETVPSTRSYYNHAATDTNADLLEDAIKTQSVEKVNKIITEIDDLSKITLSNSWNAVTYAANVGNSEILHLIMEHYPLQQIQSSFTPLMGACNVPYSGSENIEERKKCIKLLLDAKIDIDFKDRFGTNALMLACKIGRDDIVKFLLENNANVDLCDNDGWTALFYAVNNRYVEVVYLLMEYNATLNKVDKRNRKAYDIAFQKNYSEIVELLEASEDAASMAEEPTSEPVVNKRYEILESPNPKFHEDVADIVSASSKDMERYSKLFQNNGISLRDFLTVRTEQQLTDMGVTFSVHRYSLLNRVRQFHLNVWSDNSFGIDRKSYGSTEYCSLLNISNFIATLYRQMYSLRATLLYIKEDIRSSDKKDQLITSLCSIRSKLSSVNVQLERIKRTARDISLQTQPYLHAQKLID